MQQEVVEAEGHLIDSHLMERIFDTVVEYNGRFEVEPPSNRRLPQPAESYHQSWSVQSAPLPAQSNVPVDPPAIIYAPQDDRRRPPFPR